MQPSDTVAGDQSLSRASQAAMASLLNLTLLPGLSFIWLLVNLGKAEEGGIDRYHILFGIKLNLIAAVALIVVSGLMIAMGGLQSAWTWVYVITYFTFVHTVFIVTAVWALVRAWSGQPFRSALS
ncbi:MAG: hypothetical protein GY696_25470 [Gammaproteobacteria bacterium]|nr:hypothetical protein [Gammaproteobacteria bacterium]